MAILNACIVVPEKENYSGEEEKKLQENWYSGGKTPLAGLIIREREILKKQFLTVEITTCQRWSWNI